MTTSNKKTSRVNSTQSIPPVQPENNNFTIVLSIILIVGVVLIGLAFYAILGM